MDRLHLYTVMACDTAHLDEICEDIRYQYESGIASCALFMMSFVPEGNPPADKAAAFCKKYRLFQARLNAMGIPNGILIQSSIGHGYALGGRAPFQHYIALESGEEKSIICPYDRGFQDYFYRLGQTLAQTKPDCIMLDDDFRLINRKAAHGCACPLHLQRVRELTKKDYTREAILQAARSEEKQDRALFNTFIQTQSESLLEAAKVLRQGIDHVDPTLPGIFCCAGMNAENAAPIAKILAGEGNPSVVRINNGFYCKNGAHQFTHAFFRAATQIAKLKGKVDLVLAETDTCPQNRYSTSASSLHTHFTGSILEGAQGAKHWITRLAAYEPQSGVAYRRILAKHRRFYEALASLAQQVQWQGFRIPVCKTVAYRLDVNYDGSRDVFSSWCGCVLERLGLPLYFSAEDGGILCLDGESADMLTDQELIQALKGAVLLSADGAEALIKRGFGDLLGAEITKWSGKPARKEKIYATDQHTTVQPGLKQLVPFEDALVDSMVQHTLGDERYEDLFPGSLIYKNSEGGRVFLFAGTPKTEYTYSTAFSFLNYSRKQQLIRMAAQTDQLSAYYPGDEELYFRAGFLPDGSLLCALFNLGQDLIEQVELVLHRDARSVERLMPDGSRKPIAFSKNGELYTLDTPAYSLDPLILIVQ